MWDVGIKSTLSVFYAFFEILLELVFPVDLRSRYKYILVVILCGWNFAGTLVTLDAPNLDYNTENKMCHVFDFGLSRT